MKFRNRVERRKKQIKVMKWKGNRDSFKVTALTQLRDDKYPTDLFYVQSSINTNLIIKSREIILVLETATVFGSFFLF